MKEIVEKLESLNLFKVQKITPDIKEVFVLEMEYYFDENGEGMAKLIKDKKEVRVNKEIVSIDEVIKDFVNIVVGVRKEDFLTNIFELKGLEENPQKLTYSVINLSNHIAKNSRLSAAHYFVLNEKYEGKVNSFDNLRTCINNNVEDFIIVGRVSHLNQPGVTFFYDEESKLYSFELLGKHPEFNYQILNLKN